MMKFPIKTIIKEIEANRNRIARENQRQNLLASSKKIEETIEYFIEDLFFDQEKNQLNFQIIKETKKPKITRYVTQNYQKTPIYGDISIKTAVIKKFNRVINPIRFLEEEILKLDYLNKNFIYQIIAEIGIIPKWRTKEIQLENIYQKMKKNEANKRDYLKEKQTYQWKNTSLPEIPGNFWIRFFLGFLTFFLSFLGYVSKLEAEANKKTNENNKKWNEKHEKEVDSYNEKLKAEIEKENLDLETKNKILAKKYQEIANEEIKLISSDKDDWLNIKEASIFKFNDLKDKKGIYIIKNQTKNKYYVGQSKNMQKRLNDHFKNGEVNNIIFSKDWYDGNVFVFKYYFCQTKDELDHLEKQYIEEYNSFESGYNSTAGNK